MRKNRNTLIRGGFFFFFACLLCGPSGALDFWSGLPPDELADALTAQMSDSELYAQILMFGWTGADPSPLLKRWVSERRLGSVKLFGWNTADTAQVARSVSSLQSLATAGPYKIPLFVATDQEGGIVRHVKGDTSITPGNLAIGAGAYPADAYYSGFYINRELHALGINMNFAPTVDIYSNSDNTVIGPRSFGDNSESVAILGVYFAAGSDSAGVIPTAKHFPGHGDTADDSHGRLPIILVGPEIFANREVLPFKALIANNIPAIMSGHLAFPRIAGNALPASLSRVFLTDYLRGTLAYGGLIITDDLRMNSAVSAAGSLEDAYVLAVSAGNDILISSNTASLEDPCWTAVLRRMAADASFRETVKTAARRVIYTKLRYYTGTLTAGPPAPIFPDPASAAGLARDTETASFFTAQAARSITVFANNGDNSIGTSSPPERAKTASSQNVLPFSPGSVPPADPKNELASWASASSRDPVFVGPPPFLAAARIRFPRAAFLDSSFLAPRTLAAAVSSYDAIVLCVADFNDAALAQGLRRRAESLTVVSLLSPIPAFALDWAAAVVYTYSDSPVSLTAAVSAIAGDYTPAGILPLKK